MKTQKATQWIQTNLDKITVISKANSHFSKMKFRQFHPVGFNIKIMDAWEKLSLFLLNGILKEGACNINFFVYINQN